jgi:hypothetical protein
MLDESTMAAPSSRTGHKVTSMKRLLVLAAILAGCSAGASAPIKLLTHDQHGCQTVPGVGRLVADTTYGTSVVWERGGAPRLDGPVPVAWPAGFSGRQDGDEIDVVAPDGRVVAITGRRYEFSGGGIQVGDVLAFASCPYAAPPVDQVQASLAQNQAP